MYHKKNVFHQHIHTDTYTHTQPKMEKKKKKEKERKLALRIETCIRSCIYNFFRMHLACMDLGALGSLKRKKKNPGSLFQR